MADLVYSIADKAASVILNRGPAEALVRVGGADKTKFLPSINASKWDDECWLNINHKATIVGTEQPAVDAKTVQLTVGELMHRYYVADGKLEYEIVFAKKPVTNVIILDLAFSPGLRFFRQSEKPRHPGEVRAENVKGSYAVYWNRRNNDYQTGKLCHIYRPQVTDADGKTVWAELHIDAAAKTLTIAVDSVWLASARYPVTVDPTVGYETIGTTGSYSGAGDYGLGLIAVSPAEAGVTQIFHAAVIANGSTGIKLCIAETNGSGDPSGQDVIDQVAGTPPGDSDDYQIAANGGAIAASTEYALLWSCAGYGAACKYDDGHYPDGVFNVDAPYAAQFSDPLGSGWGDDDYYYSIWVTYGSAGGETTGTAATAQEPQALSAAGTALFHITGTGATNQAPQSLAAAGTALLAISGNAITTQAAQSAQAQGTTFFDISGTAATAQAPQAVAGVGTVVQIVTGTAATAQAPQAVTASGTAFFAITGVAAIAQAPQSIAASGTALLAITGAAATAQAPQTVSATGTHVYGTAGTAATTQAPQELAATGTVVNIFTGTATTDQAPQEVTATGTALLAITGSGTTTQAAQELAATGATLFNITGTATTSQAMQALAATGSISTAYYELISITSTITQALATTSMVTQTKAMASTITQALAITSGIEEG